MIGNNFSHLTLEFRGFVIYLHQTQTNKCVIAYSKKYAHAVGLVLSSRNPTHHTVDYQTVCVMSRQKGEPLRT